MLRNRLNSLLVNPHFLLSLILIAFFSKGVFLAVIQPTFTGQDEARHYNSIQLLAETEDPAKRSQATPATREQDKDDLSTYRFSEEIREAARATDNHLLRSETYHTMRFSETSVGLNEPTIESRPWSAANFRSEEYTPDAVTSTTLYHSIASLIERFFADDSILTRFYLIRLFSVILGTIAIFLAYLTARTIGFSTTLSLIITATIAFQPKLSIYLSQINYDALLIPLFFLFTYAGTRIIRDGFTPSNILLLMASMTTALLTKATGALLLFMTFPLFVPMLWQKFYRHQNEQQKRILWISTLLGIIGIIFAFSLYFFGSATALLEKLSTLPSYLEKSLSWNKTIWPSESYWGTLGWTRSWLLQTVPMIIFFFEVIASIGLLLLFFSKKLKAVYPSYLPNTNQVLFLLSMIAILQLGVRVADWEAFTRVGGMAMSLGTPGRYFLPTLLAHILILTTGLGALVAYFKQERYFNTLLLGLLILMVSFMLHTIFNVIIFRYYF